MSLLFPRPWKCHALSGFSELLSSLLISLLSPGFSPVAGNTYIQAYLRKLPPCEHPHRHPEVCLLGGPKSRQLTVLINHHNGRTGCIRYLGIFLRATWVGKSTLVFLMQTVVGTGPLFPHGSFLVNQKNVFCRTTQGCKCLEWQEDGQLVVNLKRISSALKDRALHQEHSLVNRTKNLCLYFPSGMVSYAVNNPHMNYSSLR